MRWLRATGVAAFAGLFVAGCFFGGSAACHGDDRHCSTTKGVYQQCDGGEGEYYWADYRCPGLDPVCVTDNPSSTHCEDRSNPDPCPPGLESLPGVLSESRPLRVADLDGDGSLDLLLVRKNHLALAHGDGHGSFASPVTIAVSVAGVLGDAQPADVDGDGHVDLVLSTSDPPEIYVLRGDGAGGFTLLRRYFVDRPLALVASADLDRDGRDEVVATDTEPSRIDVLSQLGDDNFTDDALTPLQFGSTEGPSSVSVGNFDRSGNLDLYVETSDGFLVLEARAKTYRVASSATYGILAADVNGDGLADVIGANGTSGYEAPFLYAYLAAGDGTLKNPVTTSVPEGASLLGALDVDGDHKVDVLASYGSASLSVFHGNGDGTFAAPRSFATSGSWQWTFRGDFDGDGRGDLAVPSSSGGVSVLRGACTVQ